MFILGTRLRFNLGKVFSSKNMNGAPTKGNLTFSSFLFHEGISFSLPHVAYLDLSIKDKLFIVVKFYLSFYIDEYKGFKSSLILNYDIDVSDWERDLIRYVRTRDPSNIFRDEVSEYEKFRLKDWCDAYTMNRKENATFS